jgi:hypothetical protein
MQAQLLRSLAPTRTPALCGHRKKMDAQALGECRHCGHRPIVRDAPYCGRCGGDEPVEAFFLLQKRRRQLTFVVVPLSIVAAVLAVVLMEFLLFLT